MKTHADPVARAVFSHTTTILLIIAVLGLIWWVCAETDKYETLDCKYNIAIGVIAITMHNEFSDSTVWRAEAFIDELYNEALHDREEIP